MHPLRIVLSFCQADQPIAYEISILLTAAGANVWYDVSHEVLPPLTQYQMLERTVFVVLLSSAALSAPEVVAACAYALKRERYSVSFFTLPILLEPLDSAELDPVLQSMISHALWAPYGSNRASEHNESLPHSSESNKDSKIIAAAIADLLLFQLALAPAHKTTGMSITSEVMYSKALIAQQRYEEARTIVEPITQMQPDLFIGWLLFGIILNKSKKPEAALTSLERARVLAPESVLPLYYLGITLANLHRDEEAVTTYEQALTMTPDNINLLNNRGILLRKRGVPDEALSSFLTALEYEPYAGSVHTNLAGTLRQLQRYEDALAQVDQVLALNEADASALAAKATIFVEAKRLTEALPLLDEAIILEPWNAELWIEKSRVFNRLGRFPEALEATDRGILITDAKPMLWNNRGATLLSLNQNVQALEALDHALALDPALELAWLNKVAVLRQLQRSAEAIAVCKARLAEYPSNSLFLRLLALLYTDVGENEEALRSVQHFLTMDSGNAEGWNLYGWILLKFQQFEAALIAFDRALAIYPAMIIALRNKAIALERLGKTNESLFALADAVKLDPKPYLKWRRRNWRTWFFLIATILTIVSAILHFLTNNGVHPMP